LPIIDLTGTALRDTHSSLLLVNYGQKKFCNIGPWTQCYKTFYGHILSIFMQVEPRAYPKLCITWVCSCLTHKHYTILERLARDKHSSSLQKFITYGCKKFYNICPCGLSGSLGGSCLKWTGASIGGAHPDFVYCSERRWKSMFVEHRHLRIYRLLNGTYRLPCLLY
jgi:hypothetical protein